MHREARTRQRRECNGGESALGQEASVPPAKYVTLRRSSRQNGANNTWLPGRLRLIAEKMDMSVLCKLWGAVSQ